MIVTSTREFRANQGKFLTAARMGQSVLLKSRYGNFKITPVADDDVLTDKTTLTDRICRGLEQAKMIEEGKLPKRTIEDMLNEL